MMDRRRRTGACQRVGRGMTVQDSIKRLICSRARLVGAAMAVFVLWSDGVPARADGVSFVADAEQAQAGGEIQHGRMFVSTDGVRFETGSGAQQVVQIVLGKQKVTRVLIPSEKIYFEYDGAAPLPVDRPDTPCTATAEMDCFKVGDEQVDGAVLEKWTANPKGIPAVMTLWWDPKRKMVLRQVYPDGRVVQMARTGTETYEGRSVERWETLYTLPTGQSQKAVQLFDTELSLAVRERHPNGTTRRLLNIKKTPANPAWFAIPDGYKKMDAPVTPTGPDAADRSAPMPGRTQ